MFNLIKVLCTSVSHKPDLTTVHNKYKTYSDKYISEGLLFKRQIA